MVSLMTIYQIIICGCLHFAMMSMGKSLQVEIDENRCEIETLKQIFKTEINSRRRFEEISDIKDLLSVLENRSAISSETWEALEEDVRNFIKSVYNISRVSKKVGLPKTVVDWVCQNFESDWKDFGLHLKLTEVQLLKCRNVEEVLLNFEENCQGVSERELLFRLMRALKKSCKPDLKPEIVKLMAKDSS